LPQSWQRVNEGGQNVLVGQGSISEPFILLGRDLPEWLNTPDFVLNMRVNLGAREGVRVVFRYDENVGYEVLEMTAGVLNLRRSREAGNSPISDRSREVRLGNASVPVQLNEWHSLTVWVEGRRTTVYLNNRQVINVEDTNQPQLGAGRILFQTQNNFNPIRFDDIVIQRAEGISEHFEAGLVPATWRGSSVQKVFVQRENNNNQYLRLEGISEAAPLTGEVQDYELRCRLMNSAGGHELYLRDSANGTLRFDFFAGNMTLDYLDEAGTPVFTRQFRNLYGRNRWDDFYVLLLGNRLEFFYNGANLISETFDSLPPAGSIRFVAPQENDILRVDDCLLTLATTERSTGANFAFDIQQQVLDRPFRRLRSDLDETFRGADITRAWWLDGEEAMGVFTEDPASDTNRYFLRLVNLGGPTWRLFSDRVGVRMFGDGEDRNDFSDATNLYITVQTRLLSAGSACLGIRSTLTTAGADVQGYRLCLQKDAAGAFSLLIDYQSATRREVFYEGGLPNTDAAALPEWVDMRALSYRDKLAFFVNGQFVTFIENAEKLGGTLSLSVGEGTTADFDELIIRDSGN
jgi:hypothetical protein